MNRTLFAGLSCFLIALAGCGGGGGGSGASSGVTAMLPYVPKNAIGAAYVRVADILAIPAVKAHEATIKQMAAESADQFPPDQVIDVLMAFVPTPGKMPPYEPVAIVRFKDASFKAYVEKQFAEAEKKEHGGKSYLKPKAPNAPALYYPDATTAVFANEDLLKGLLDGGGGGGVCAELFARSHMKGHVQQVAVVTGERDKLDGQLAILAFMPPAVAGLADVPKWVDRTAVSIDLNGDNFLVIELAMIDADKAKQSQEKLKAALDFGLTTAAQMLPMLAQQPEGAEFVGKLQPVVDDLKAHATVTQSGQHVTLTAPLSAKSRESLHGLIKPLVDAANQARGAAKRMQAANNLKQAGLAAHNHMSQSGAFPANIVDAEGKPILSWRVALLKVDAPFGPPLTGEIALDKAWDSPENMAVTKVDGGEVHKTRLAMFTGTGTLLEGNTGKKVSDVKDGMSNTILYVEVSPEKAVPFTQPIDLPFDPANPIAALGDLPEGGFNVVFCDGSVRWISKTIKPETLKALITPAGGEPVDFSELD